MAPLVLVEDCHEPVGWLLVQDALVGRLGSPYHPKDCLGQAVRVSPSYGWIEEYSRVLLVFSSRCLLSCGASFLTFPLAEENPIVRPESE